MTLEHESDRRRDAEIHREGDSGPKDARGVWGDYCDWRRSREHGLYIAKESIISESQKAPEMPGASTTPSVEDWNNPEIRAYREDVRRLLKWNPNRPSIPGQGGPPSSWARRVAMAVRMLEVQNPINQGDWESEGKHSKSEEDAKWKDWKYDPAMIPTEEEFHKFRNAGSVPIYGLEDLAQAIYYLDKESTKGDE